MKNALAILFVVMGIAGGAYSVVQLLTVDSAVEKIEFPNWYVYASGLEKANSLCAKSGGIFRIGSIRIPDGQKYELHCIHGDKMVFEIKD